MPGHSIDISHCARPESAEPLRMNTKIISEQNSGLLERSTPLSGASGSEAKAGDTGTAKRHSVGANFSSYIGHFESVAAEYADSCAVSTGGEFLTYRELDRRATRLAAALGDLVLPADSIVAVCLARSNALAIALLAVLKANAAFLPLDPAFPRERLRDLVGRSGAVAVFTQREYASIFDSCGVEVMDAEQFRSASSDLQTRAPRRTPAPESLAYVIYTSGSSGAPKGAGIGQAAFYHYLRWAANYYEFDPAGVSVVHTSIAFDLSLTSLFCPLLRGMRMVMVPDDEGMDGVIRMLDADTETISLLKLTPTHLRLMAEARGNKSGEWRCDALVVGGEQLRGEDLRFWERLNPSGRIFNEYGPTEATVGCCVARVTSRGMLQDGSLPIGSAIDDVSLTIGGAYTDNGAGKTEGELLIGGDCLARGYLNSPALTAAKFVPDPAFVGGRLYRSGDMVRRIDGQTLAFLGRQDRQRKVNGVRIELEEIEAIIGQFPGIRSAAVSPVTGPEGREVLAAFLSLIDPKGARPQLSELLAHLKSHFFNPVVPRTFYLAEKLPATPGGKVDYQKLIRERAGYIQLSDGFVPPRNPVEELLASLWREILNLDEVGIEDSFFALDGNSMKSIQFIYEAKKHNLSLSTKDLFERQTIRSLAELVNTQVAGNGPSPDVKPAAFALVSVRDRERMPADAEDAYPMAMLQAGTLFESDNRLGSGTYHNINSYHLECEFDAAAFEKSLRFVMLRHPILRTSYNYVDYDKPLQIVHRESKVPLHVTDIADLPAEEQERFLDLFVEEESRTAFERATPPLLRFFIHLRGPRRLQFTLSKHHSILDGWSAATLIAEIVKNYFALRRNQPAAFRFPVETTYRDFVALEQQAIHSRECAEFWRQTLREAPYHALQAWGGKRPVADCAHSSISTRRVEISEELSSKLKLLARGAHVPLKSALLAVHLRVLAQMTGRARVVTGMVSHGRPETREADKTVGLFINTVPFHLLLAERYTWKDLIGRVFREECRVFPYQRYPMARIKNEMGWERLFDSIFYFTNFQVFRDFRDSEDLKFLGSKSFEETETPFTVAFSLHPLTSLISLNLHFHIDRFTETQIENVVGYFEKAMAAAAAGPELPVLSQSILSEAEIGMFLAGRNKVQPEQPARTVFDLFREQARRSPHRIALNAEGDAVTYGAMLRRSEHLAGVLTRAGVTAESIVGIHTSDLPGAIILMMAVNRAGGCFAMLDAQWPQKRLTEVVDALRPAFIVTQRALQSRFSGSPCLVFEEMIAAETKHAIGSVPGSGDSNRGEIAYIMFTSGSTGKPKGVMVSNRNLYYSTRGRLLYYGPTYDRFLLLSRLTFDSAFAGVFGTLCGNGTLHLMKEDRQTDIGRIASIIAEDSITHFLTVPSLYRVLLPALSMEGRETLKVAIMAGEELTRELVCEHQEQLPEVTLYNEYGPTEGTVWATVAEIVAKAGPRNGAGVSIGKAIAGVETLVLDKSMRPSAFGVPGELYIGGLGVARGYYNAPAATAARFLPDPYAVDENKGAVLYRTGDVVLCLPDGELQFIGRADNQMKVRGVRIEPEEIERAFYECFDVREAMAGLREDVPGRRKICLYYVASAAPEQGCAIPTDIQDVKAKLGEKLPGYMLPDDLVEVERLPRLWNNKLDRNASPLEYAVVRNPTAHEEDQPTGEIERALAGIWAEVLGCANVGVRRSFFDIGGDSLLANQVVLKTEKIFGAKMLIKEFYQVPTIAAHANILKARGGEANVDVDRIASIWNRIN